MNTSKLHLYLLPQKYWERQDDPLADISFFVKDALAIERRLKKGVNLADEWMRYRLCCRRIQAAISRFKEDMEEEVLSECYLPMLRLLYTDDKTLSFASASRIAANFFPPDKIAEQISEFQKITEVAGISDHEDVIKRLNFFSSAQEKGAGIIEAIQFFVSNGKELLSMGNVAGNISLTIPETSMHTIHTLSKENVGFDMEDTLTPKERQGMLEVLTSQIEKALQTGEGVNFSNQPHPVITDALNKYVYKENPDQEEGLIRVIYMDGSEAAPFPLRCLIRTSHKELSDNDPLKVSLISMRHLAMDSHVDMAWFRNREVSVPRPFAETDAICTARTVELLEELRNKPFCIHLYQTGLETAVIGFYRGLIQFLKTQKDRQLTVIPYYYSEKERTYEKGNPWC